VRREGMRKKYSLIFLLAAGLVFLTSDARADWDPAIRLTWTSGNSFQPAIAIGSDYQIHVVWNDDTPGNGEIYYKKSSNSGGTWSTAKRLTLTSEGSSHPAIAIDANDALHVVWQDTTPGNYEIYYLRSQDGGTNWSAARRITWTSGESRSPAIAAGSGNSLHVVWHDDTPGEEEIYYKRSSDGGTTWSSAFRITWTSVGSYDTNIAADSKSTIYVVWENMTPGSSEVYYKTSTDGGSTWSVAKRLTWTSGSSAHPAIVIDATDVVHVVWQDNTPGNYELYHKKSTDGGSAWSAARRLTWTSGFSWVPAAAVDSTAAVCVVWYDDTPGNPEVYFKRSADEGASWSTAERLSGTSGSSSHPSIAINPGNTIYVVWEDDTPGNSEIYYRRGKY
jgi:hypothetical protein